MLVVSGQDGEWITTTTSHNVFLTRFSDTLALIESGMALVSESASGLVLGLNVPDTHQVLLKSMKLDFVKKCEGEVKPLVLALGNS